MTGRPLVKQWRRPSRQLPDWLAVQQIRPEGGCGAALGRPQFGAHIASHRALVHRGEDRLPAIERRKVRGHQLGRQ